MPTELKGTTKRGELLPFLPTGGGTPGGLVALAALVALTANVALVRRSGRLATA